MKKDEKCMALALKEAEKARGHTGYRPFVGCVIEKNGRIIARGFTQKNACEHAEAHALKKCGKKAKGSTLYSTLEPCHHNSQGTSCSRLIAERGIVRVVWGCHDPAEKNKEGSTAWLRKKGIRVTGNVLEKECKQLHAAFLTNIEKKRPFVFVSVAMSLDGKTTWKKGKMLPAFSSKKTLKKVHDLRSKSTAIAVGYRTIAIDNPRLTARTKKGKNPVRIIFDSLARTPKNARVFLQPGKTIIVVTRKAPEKRCRALQKKGTVIKTSTGKRGMVNLKQALHLLYRDFRVSDIMVEGGGTLIAGLLREKLVDCIYCWYSPVLIGGRDTPTGFDGTALAHTMGIIPVVVERVEHSGNDILIMGTPHYPRD